MEPPFFSVIIPTHNRAHMLPKAIESVLKQTFANLELIIVDDGSTDNTMEVVKSYSDGRIRYVWQENLERSNARNNGIKNAVGKYICFLDSDDYYLDDRLELLFNKIKLLNEPLAMLYTGICFEKDNTIIPREEIKNIFNNKMDFIIKAIIGVPQVCIASGILKKHFFNSNFHIGEDMELWLRIVNEFPLIYLDNQFTVIALVHDDRSVNEKKNNPGKEQLRLLKYIFKKDHTGYKVSKKYKKERISDTYFSISRHNIYNNKKISAISNLLISVLKKTFHQQTKHKFYLIYKLIFKQKINEYSQNLENNIDNLNHREEV